MTITSKILGMSVIVVLGLVACQPSNVTEKDMSTTPNELSIDEAPIDEVVEVKTFADIATMVEVGDRSGAITLGEELLKDVSPSEANKILDTYFDRGSDKKDNRIAIVLAEVISAKAPKNSKATYLAGLAYWGNGITVSPDPVRVVEYWDTPSFEANQTVQSRLADIYGDVDSPLYDPEKSRLASQRAGN